MLRDYASPHRLPSRRKRRRLLVPVFLVLACLTLWLVLAQGEPLERAKTLQAANVSPPATNPVKTISGSLKPGETISTLLSDVMTPGEIHDLAQQCRAVYPLRNICAGRPYQVSVVNGSLSRFICDIDNNDQLVVSRETDGFAVKRQPIPFSVKLVTTRGTIDSSLFEAVVAAGESEAVAMQLADVFAWDIDFFHDIQPGDSFELVVEKRFRDGRPAGNGRLLAARFTNQGQLCQAYYFKDGKRAADYYDENGRSLRKAFLKAPLSFSRISSGFNLRRRHPITHRIKAHPAIDFAAPKGTPIHTIGDGTVVFAAYKRYNGKCVKIRHPNGWMTMYNHMSRFARGMRPGKRIAQGQVIGYVGSTGLSTGPHLDFRMYRNGAPVNPLRVKSPPARPVSRANMMAFRMMVAERVAFMETSPERKTAGLFLAGRGVSCI